MRRSECRIRREDDHQVRWIEVKGRTAGDRNNMPPTHLLGIVSDITTRKTAEQLWCMEREGIGWGRMTLGPFPVTVRG